MLTLTTQIPTMARGQVRAIVKAHPAWPAFLAEKALISADAKNRDLIELALRHPKLKARIELLISPEAAKRPEEQILGIQGFSTAALEELRASTKVRNLVEEIEALLRQVKTALKPRVRVRAKTVQFQA